jgi:hypothetical protein
LQKIKFPDHCLGILPAYISAEAAIRQPNENEEGGGRKHHRIAAQSMMLCGTRNRYSQNPALCFQGADKGGKCSMKTDTRAELQIKLWMYRNMAALRISEVLQAEGGK